MAISLTFKNFDYPIIGKVFIWLSINIQFQKTKKTSKSWIVYQPSKLDVGQHALGIFALNSILNGRPIRKQDFEFSLKLHWPMVIKIKKQPNTGPLCFTSHHRLLMKWELWNDNKTLLNIFDYRSSFWTRTSLHDL